MTRDNGVKLNKTTVRRIAETTRYTEQIHRNEAPVISGAHDFGGCVVMKITTATGRMSGGTPDHTGRGYIQTYSGSGAFANSLPLVAYPILNTTTSVFAVGSYVTCASAYGYWTILNVDTCSHLS